MTTIKLPQADGTLAAFTPRAAVTWPAPSGSMRWNRVAFAAAHVVADPRAAIDPWLGTADRLGHDARLSPPPVVARLRRGRSDGHRAARNGARLADLARAYPAERARSAGHSGCHRLFGCRHGPPSGRRDLHDRRCDRRLRSAVRRDRGGGRPHHPDGEPRTRRLRAFA